MTKAALPPRRIFRFCCPGLLALFNILNGEFPKSGTSPGPFGMKSPQHPSHPGSSRNPLLAAAATCSVTDTARIHCCSHPSGLWRRLPFCFLHGVVGQRPLLGCSLGSPCAGILCHLPQLLSPPVPDAPPPRNCVSSPVSPAPEPRLGGAPWQNCRQGNSQEGILGRLRQPHLWILALGEQQLPWEHPGAGALPELLVFPGCSRVGLSEAPQSLTGQGQEFLELRFQPADFLTKLDVVHPAETQTEPLRGKTGRGEVPNPRSNTQPVPVVGISDFPLFSTGEPREKPNKGLRKHRSCEL